MLIGAALRLGAPVPRLPGSRWIEVSLAEPSDFEKLPSQSHTAAVEMGVRPAGGPTACLLSGSLVLGCKSVTRADTGCPNSLKSRRRSVFVHSEN